VDDLRPHIRLEPPQARRSLLRGGDDTVQKLRRHAEARQPSLTQPGTIVLAGDDDAPAVAEVVDLIPKETGTIVHLRILPGLLDDDEALVRRVRGPGR
jgi:hypothetical protein